MKLPTQYVAAALLALLLPLASFSATRVKVQDIEVTGRPVFDHMVYHGYTEYRFIVINHSATEPHVVTVELNSSSFRTTTISKTVSVPPGSRMEFPMFQNRYKAYQTMQVTVDQRHEKRAALDESNRGSVSSGSTKTSLLLSKSINQDDFQDQIETIERWTSSSDFRHRYSLRRTDLAPNEWSENWLAYSSFDGIIMQASDLEAMPPKIVAALKQYVESGGVLTLTGTDQCPFSGSGIERLNPTVYAVGMGRCFTYPETAPDRSSYLTQDVNQWKNTQTIYNVDAPEGLTNDHFPVVDNMTIPVRGFLLLVTLFALIAGPLTLIVLAKTNRRIWLLWIIPLESAVACGIVLVYALFSEGITPTVRIKSITLLDQQQHTAVSLGWIGYYCPQRPSEGLLFADDWEINPVRNFYQNNSRTTIDWTRGQHLQDGWIQSRIPTFLMCRRNSIRRERLEFTETDVVNGLGAEIEHLWYCAADGSIYETENVLAGQKSKLIPNSALTPANSPEALRSLFTESYRYHIDDSLKEHPENYLLPGTYVAALKGTPFMEHGLGDRKLNLTAESMVYGFLPKENLQ